MHLVQYRQIPLLGGILVSLCLLAQWADAADMPARAFYDTWTYVRSLEDGKAYSSLATFLESLVDVRTVELTTKSAADPRTYDPEGVVYLLDDLAEIYSRGLVDFQKAQAYNARVIEAYEKLRSVGLEAVPISDYFTPRRKLYYYLYPLESSAGSAGSRELRDGETYVRLRQDIATLLPLQVLDSVRASDLEKLRERVERRQDYLREKLGAAPAKTRRGDDTIGSTEEFALLETLLEKLNVYNGYYRNVYLASRMWFLHKQGGAVNYQELARFCKDALETEIRGRLKDDLDSRNLLVFWLGTSYIKLGNVSDGAYYLRRFFTGLDEIDDLEERLAKSRKKVMGKAIEEKEKAAETLAAVLLVAGQVAQGAARVAGQLAMQGVAQSYAKATYYSLDQALTGLQRTQQTIQTIATQTQLISAAISLGTHGLSRLSMHTAGLETEETRKLAGLITPLALKAARYLDKFDQVELFADLGRSYEVLRQHGRAIRFYGEALSIIEAQRSTISSESQRISFSAVKEDLYKRIVRLLVAERRMEKAFEYVERAKARAFLDVLASKREIVLKSASETELLSSILRGKDEVSALLDGTDLGFEQVASVLSRRRDLAVVGSSTPSMTAELESLAEGRVITADEALRLTKDEFSIVQYFLGEDRVYLFLIDDGRLVVREVEADRNVLFGLINVVRQGISNPGQTMEATTRASRELHKLLIAPVRGLVSKKRIYIIPHGWLYYIPFQVLMEGEKYLVEDFAITYAPSVTVLKHLLSRRVATSKESVLIVANADLGDPRYDLPFADKEALFVASSFRDANILLREKATESEFKEHASEYDVIHIATHAYFDAADPLRSAVLLSADGMNDGRLEVTELYQMSLKATLVVLSACETSLAYIVRGDELIGLVRGVLYSGASSVLGTLWKVADESTADFMRVFYEKYKTLPKDLALQQAQIEAMRTSRSVFNWAPFILTGGQN